jgi:hypothetical protein
MKYLFFLCKDIDGVYFLLLLTISGVILSTVLTMVFPVYTIALPAVSATAIAVLQAAKYVDAKTAMENLYRIFWEKGVFISVLYLVKIKYL